MKSERFIFIVPNPGECVMDPDERFARVPPEGKRVRASTFWAQIIADGAAVERAEATPIEPKPATKASKADS